MNVTDYDRKLHELVSDPSKFTPCDAKQNDKVKVKVNKIANNLKISHPAHFYKIRKKCDYNNGHLYGLPKIHKDLNNSPLRLIISMSGSVTHEVAQYMKNIIQPYIDTRYVLRSR